VASAPTLGAPLYPLIIGVGRLLNTLAGQIWSNTLD
jgi:hypothetical protein